MQRCLLLAADAERHVAAQAGDHYLVRSCSLIEIAVLRDAIVASVRHSGIEREHVSRSMRLQAGHDPHRD